VKLRARKTAYGSESGKPNEVVQTLYRIWKTSRCRIRDLQRLKHEIMHKEGNRCDQASGYQEEEPRSRAPCRPRRPRKLKTLPFTAILGNVLGTALALHTFSLPRCERQLTGDHFWGSSDRFWPTVILNDGYGADRAVIQFRIRGVKSGGISGAPGRFAHCAAVPTGPLR
jgi:hypothetical protein